MGVFPLLPWVYSHGWPLQGSGELLLKPPLHTGVVESIPLREDSPVGVFPSPKGCMGVHPLLWEYSLGWSIPLQGSIPIITPIGREGSIPMVVVIIF